MNATLTVLKANVEHWRKAVDRKWNKFDAIDHADSSKRTDAWIQVQEFYRMLALSQEQYIEALEAHIEADAAADSGSA